jgi:quinol-cytochrome oxidoreductase complex cytochrome b subunit
MTTKNKPNLIYWLGVVAKLLLILKTVIGILIVLRII